MRCGAQVFTTCGSERKRRYLLDTFPGLRADHIGDSRSTSFEAMVKHLVPARYVCKQLQLLMEVPLACRQQGQRHVRSWMVIHHVSLLDC